MKDSLLDISCPVLILGQYVYRFWRKVMPIYEFKCRECEEFFELLVMGKTEEDEMKCPKCGAQSFERIMSRTNFNVTGGSSACSGPSDGTAGVHERQCSSGSCTTYTVPGVD